MSIKLERVNPKTGLFEQITDQMFASVIRGKVVRDVRTFKDSWNWRTMIDFSDGSSLAADEDRGQGAVLRYLRPEKERVW